MKGKHFFEKRDVLIHVNPLENLYPSYVMAQVPYRQNHQRERLIRKTEMDRYNDVCPRLETPPQKRDSRNGKAILVEIITTKSHTKLCSYEPLARKKRLICASPFYSVTITSLWG
jgi:hypothetical protein